MRRHIVRLAAILILGSSVASVAAGTVPAVGVVPLDAPQELAPLLAFTSSAGQNKDSEVHVIRADKTGHRVLTNNRLNDRVTGWSPHGRWLTYILLNRRGVASHYAREVDGSGLVYIGGMISGGVWSPDDRRVLTEHRTGHHLQVVDMETGARRPVFDEGWGYLEGFGWSPDASTILFAARRYNDFDVPKVFAADPDGSRLRRLVRNGRAPASSPDGSWIAFLRDINVYYSTVYVVRPDGSGLRRLSPVRINDGLGAWRWSPDGRRIAIEQNLRNTDPRLGVLDVERGGVTWLSEGRRYAGVFEWMPDGKRILFLCGSYSAYGLCLADVKSGGVHKISSRRMPIGYVFDLAADGQNVAFTNDKGVYVMTLSSRRLRHLTRSGYFDSWSQDGEWVSVQLKNGLHVIRLRDGLARRIAAGSYRAAAWQPRAL